LVKGPERCLAWLHPLDAAELGVADGDRVRIRARVGEIDIAVQLNDAMARRVVSVPHGWSHGEPRVRQRLAQGRSGANVNLLRDDADCDRPSGNAAFTGVPVSVRALIRSACRHRYRAPPWPTTSSICSAIGSPAATPAAGCWGLFTLPKGTATPRLGRRL